MSDPFGEPLVFWMGKFEAPIPQDRLYCKNHMWAQFMDDAPLTEQAGFSAQEKRTSGLVRFGFSAYAVRLLQDVYFLEWIVDCPATVREKQQVGAIESKKAESDLFAPASGTLTQLNAELLSDPSAINVDKYGNGWLFEMSVSAGSFLTAAEYLDHLAAVWEVTQRTIKGQLND